ncbi:MAG: hypothetical protein WDO73_27815 [Ignavibacteriota bacterium]
MKASLAGIGVVVTIAFCGGVLACAQDYSKIVIESVGKNFAFTEGPAWSKEGYMVFSDTVAPEDLEMDSGRRTGQLSRSVQRRQRQRF